jgi:Lon protease-like protein
VAGDDDPGGEPSRTLTVPLFPLPATVLFPRVRQPFYVFEPRYRAMLRSVLDGDGLIGFPLLLREGAETAPPRISEVFGVGSVVDYDTHEDGTSHIEVLGRFRVRTLAELPSTPFRQARVRVLPDEEPAQVEAEALRDALSEALRRLDQAGLAPEARSALSQILAGSARNVPFLVHMLCTIVIGSPEVRQKLLEEDRVVERGRALITILETLRQELGRPPASD